MICEAQPGGCKHEVNIYSLVLLFMGGALSDLAKRFEIFIIYLETFGFGRCS